MKDSFEFYDQIKSAISTGIEEKNLDLKSLIKIVAKYNELELLDKFQNEFYQLGFKDEVEKENLYGHIFGIVNSYLRDYKGITKGKRVILTDGFVKGFIDNIIDIVVNKRTCTVCYSSNISEISHISGHTVYSCRFCQDRVKTFSKSTHLPIFCMYIQDWITSLNNKGKDTESNNPFRQFIDFSMIKCFDHYSEQGQINSIILFYEILRDNGIQIESLSDRNHFKELLVSNIKNSLETQNLYDFIKGNEYFKTSRFGSIDENIDNFNDLIFEFLVSCLRRGSALKLQESINYFMNEGFLELPSIISNPLLQKRLEESFYKGLSKCLRRKENFGSFKELVNFSTELNIFIDMKKIPKRFDILFRLLRDQFMGVFSLGFDPLGDIIETLKFYNNYNLFERDFSKEELEYLETIKIQKNQLKNLEDIFEKVSNSLIYYILHEMPLKVYEIISQYFNQSNYPIEDVFLALNGFIIYGLSVQHIGKLDDFFSEFKESGKVIRGETKLMEFYFCDDSEQPSWTRSGNINKKHLVSPENLEKVERLIETDNDYKFYSLSMVLLGGLGPQGHGFTYSTPMGEVIEICSDRRENEAIIVKYKQFLKQQFLYRLEKEMITLKINPEDNQKIIDFLSDIIYSDELINYYKKEPILLKIKKYFDNEQSRQLLESEHFQKIMEKISNAMDIILRPIDMIDQFKCRMDLIAEKKIKPEDIAKLTSLKDKSHYDVLRERFFYQQILEIMQKVYSRDIMNFENRRFVS